MPAVKPQPLPKELAEIQAEMQGYAREYGLDFYPTIFELIDADGRVLGRCDRSGFFSSSWDLELSTGTGQLERVGWFATGFQLMQGGRVAASVDRIGWCERGWIVEGSDSLTEEDLLLIGLVYQVIQQRQARQQQAGGHAAGS